MGWLERVYNRRSTVRSEVKVQDVSPESIYTLLKGGVGPFHVMQANFALVKQAEKLVESIKFLNRERVDADVKLGRIFTAVLEVLERLDTKLSKK